MRYVASREEIENAYEISGGELEGQRPLGRGIL
jgi:hypothetical protein